MKLQYKHILWDWNGTLLNDLWLCVQVMNSLLEKRHLPLLDQARYQEVFTFPIRDYYQGLGFDFATHSFEDLSVEFMDQYESRKTECSLAPSARTLLETLRQAGIGQTILSAYPYSGLVQIIQHYQLEPFFETLLGLSDIYASSKLALGKEWFAHKGYNPSEVLMVGDTLHDFEVAQAIGADCLLVASGHNSKARLSQCDTTIIDSLQELPRLINLSL